MASQTSSDESGAFGHFLLGAVIVALTAGAYLGLGAYDVDEAAAAPHVVAPID